MAPWALPSPGLPWAAPAAASSPPAASAPSLHSPLAAAKQPADGTSFCSLAADTLGRILVPSSRLPSVPQTSPLSPAATAALYAAHSRSAAVHIESAHADTTIRARSVAMQKLGDHLARLPPALGLSLATCSPIDLLVFLESLWPKAPPGEPLPLSFAYFKNMVSCWGTGFDLLGRTGAWDEGQRRGNPARGIRLSLWLGALKKAYKESGVQPEAAVPLTLDKLELLLTKLDAAALSSSSSLERLILLRDAALFGYLFASCQRGGEGAMLRRSGLHPIGSTSAAGEPLSLRVQPDRLKNWSRGADPPAILLDRASDRPCVARLWAFLELSSALGHPIRPAGYIFRTCPHGRFEERPLTCSAVQRRLELHLRAYGLHEGETAHSFRRGGVRHLESLGLTDPELQARMAIKSGDILPLYTDKRRHLKGRRGRALVRPGGALQAEGLPRGSDPQAGGAGAPFSS